MSTYNDPHHSNPHGQFPARLFGQHEREDASCETAQVVDGDDDAFKRRTGVIERVKKVCIANDPREDSLIVAEEEDA